MTVTYRESTPPTTGSLELACPRCQAPLVQKGETYLCTFCGPQGTLRDGIPSFASPDFYWGEIPRDEMQQILEKVRRRGWRRAVHEDLAREYPDRYRYLFSPLRADWFYTGCVTGRGRALDLGAGWGGLSLLLSRLFDQVVAVEGVWERARFASLLFANEGAGNALAIHADMHSPPLPPGAFDLVVMNGVLEWAALGGPEADPEAAQRALLGTALRMLRPGGSLYLGIENRFALIFLLGGRDHGSPRWMGVLPRPLARWYRWLARLPERRPLTHSLAGYRRLLQESGFQVDECYAAFPSYSYPRVLVPMADPRRLAWAAKLSLDWRGDGLTLGAHLLHKLACRPAVSRLACPLAESLVIWARRPARAASRPCPHPGLRAKLVDQVISRWTDLGLEAPAPSRLSIVSTSSNWGIGGKVSWFLFPPGARRPTLVARISRTPDDGGRTANEHHALTSLSQFGPEISNHLPRAMAHWQMAGHSISLQRYVPGESLARHLCQGRASAALAAALEMCLPFLAALAWNTRREVRPLLRHPFVSSLLARAEKARAAPDCPDSAAKLIANLVQMIEAQGEAPVPVIAHHGDLNAADILVYEGHFWVTDWEWFTPEGLPFLDLITLAASAAARTGWAAARMVPRIIRALVGDEAGLTPPLSSRERAIGREYAQAAELTDEVRVPLAACALLHALLKDREARYSGSAEPLSEDGLWARAARPLLVTAAAAEKGGRP